MPISVSLLIHSICFCLGNESDSDLDYDDLDDIVVPSDADDFLDDDDGADVEDDHSIASSTTTISTGIKSSRGKYLIFFQIRCKNVIM